MKKSKRGIWMIIIIGLFGLGASTWFFFLSPDRYTTPIVLKGTVVTPDEIIDPGWVAISDGKIQSVSTQQPKISKAVEIDTGGLIFPGLINLHDHVVWNIIPRWEPDHLYLNRYEWRDGDDDDEIGAAVSGLSSDHICDMNTYGEVRALVGGTTSILGTWRKACINGLVRNLDYDSGFYTLPLVDDPTHIQNYIDLPLETNEIEQFLKNRKSEAFFIHLSEGRGPAMRAEYDQLVEKGLLTDKTVIIHGTALEPEQFQTMREQGAALIWSPRSNLELYGQTADITAALDSGVMIAIGPDWAITGSSNILDELRLAAEWNSLKLNNRISAQQLVEMVTKNPAIIAGIDDSVGTISEGKYADLLVITGDTTKPYQTLINADPGDIQLVLINGIPVYGKDDLMGHFWSPSDLSQINVLGNRMALYLAEFSNTVDELEMALASYGFELAPIVEPGYTLGNLQTLPDEELVGVPYPTGEIDWQDAVHYFGERKAVCGPVVSTFYAASTGGQPTYINIGEPYPSISRVTVIIWGTERVNFPGNPEDNYANESICVTGNIISYRGAAHIFVAHPRDIESGLP